MSFLLVELSLKSNGLAFGSAGIIETLSFMESDSVLFNALR